MFHTSSVSGINVAQALMMAAQVFTDFCKAATEFETTRGNGDASSRWGMVLSTFSDYLSDSTFCIDPIPEGLEGDRRHYSTPYHWPTLHPALPLHSQIEEPVAVESQSIPAHSASPPSE